MPSLLCYRVAVYVRCCIFLRTSCLGLCYVVLRATQSTLISFSRRFLKSDFMHITDEIVSYKKNAFRFCGKHSVKYSR